MDNDDYTFWMVWAPSGHAPILKHYKKQDAINEAERLANKHPQQSFFVLQALEERRVDNMTRIELVDIPF